MSRELFKHILVPHDFTPESDRALRMAAGFAASVGGALTVLHVITPFYPLREVTQAGAGLLDTKELEARVLVRLEGRVASVLGTDATRCQVVTGNPGQRIVHAAAGASCIVMPTSGRTGAAHALIGSTAERVVRFSPTPVLVLPPLQRRGAPRAAQPARRR
jgi:nucleotide-binding universal stress UspA family protein